MSLADHRNKIFYPLFRYMNAEKYNLERIYFGGCFIRGMPVPHVTLSYHGDVAIQQWAIVEASYVPHASYDCIQRRHSSYTIYTALNYSTKC